MDLNSALIPDSDIRHLGMLPDTACGNEVQGFDVGLGRGDDDIGIGTHTINDSTTPLKAHGDLPLGIGTAGNVVDRIQLQVTARIHQGLDRLEGGIHKAATFRLDRVFIAIYGKGKLCLGHYAGLGANLHAYQSVATDLFLDRKSTRLNSSHVRISYAVFCLKKKKKKNNKKKQ